MTVTDAYAWVNKEIEKLPDIEQIHHSEEHGLDSGLDEAIRWFLDKVGLMDKLEEVTGMPTRLTQAAQEWKAQGEALHRVSAELRSRARGLPEQWAGDASEGFGHSMGKIIDALDDTGKDMGKTAQILSQAAKESKFAEDSIVAIIREAIEWAAMTLAAMVVTDILTLGLATVVDGLVAEAEVAVFLTRVEKVSAELAKTLRELMKAVKEFKSGAKSFNEARKAAGTLRKLGGPMGKGAFRSKDWWAHHLVSGKIAEYGSKPLLNEATGLTGDFKTPAEDAIKHFGGEALDDQGPKEPEPYHVPKRSIEDTFG
ncbi:WXG100 family type VII secretion target [Streptomyces benahoarensis]|uniref:WXG100 family type VII secretion target n=1 Tax=Streptomyces benahoarensis TaxID=2595054 RepID=A0A553ZRU7_9ACTN|nr:WXG100 family type VII secretion target [Streptomyces benahoarensis]TSB32642.1 WXG100 family type VII secretion target [Streptomyces benahoarensis]TSB44198.1 WXG100 family type VII secretion target [Streptomyces benahoarensis]